MVLYIDACFRENSRTRALCRSYIRKNYTETDKIERIALSETPFMPLDADSLAKRERDAAAGEFSSADYEPARNFADADELLIGAPYWDCSFPAALKIYLERICVNGITFGYGGDGSAVKMCRAKKLVYITTAGGYLPEPNSTELYFKELCAMFAIPELKFYSAQGLDIAGCDVSASLARVENEF